MHQIIRAEKLNNVTALFEIKAPPLAKKVKAGQFVVLRIKEEGERIPLTIAKKNPDKGTITIIFHIVGKTTEELARLGAGDFISDLIGPLGRETDFGKRGKVIFISGGVGTAEVLPVAEYAKEEGNDITIIIGARTKGRIILEDELRKLTDKIIVTTDDGSYCLKGLITTPLKELLEKEKFDLAYCVGPDIMMKAVCDVTKEFNLKTLVSLDANMVDATGMCGTCRVIVGGKVRFTCVDGPEFDGHLVDWDNLLKRQKRFQVEEKKSLELYMKECKCHEKARS